MYRSWHDDSRIVDLYALCAHPSYAHPTTISQTWPATVEVIPLLCGPAPNSFAALREDAIHTATKSWYKEMQDADTHPQLSVTTSASVFAVALTAPASATLASSVLLTDALALTASSTTTALPVEPSQTQFMKKRPNEDHIDQKVLKEDPDAVDDGYDPDPPRASKKQRLAVSCNVRCPWFECRLEFGSDHVRFLNHYRRHTFEPEFQCGRCNAGFYTYKRFLNHRANRVCSKPPKKGGSYRPQNIHRKKRPKLEPKSFVPASIAVARVWLDSLL
jgi:hypothetical protein